jgi:5-deoxy-glucuronate isomerase
MDGRMDGGRTDAVITFDGPRYEPLLEAGPEGRLGAARTEGTLQGRTNDGVAWVLVEGGRGELAAGSQRAEVDGRTDVFDGPGWSALLGPGTDFALTGDVAATFVWRSSDRAVETAIIDPATVPDEQRGDGATVRRVRTYVPEGPLIVGETLNPPGGWSSWPPHRHEHEECYLYRFEPANGFGVHVGFDDSGAAPVDEPVIVRDGHIERIRTGWHPVVAAPGATMYYLWALAGAVDTLDTRTHADFS